MQWKRALSQVIQSDCIVTNVTESPAFFVLALPGTANLAGGEAGSLRPLGRSRWTAAFAPTLPLDDNRRAGTLPSQPGEGYRGGYSLETVIDAQRCGPRPNSP